MQTVLNPPGLMQMNSVNGVVLSVTWTFSNVLSELLESVAGNVLRCHVAKVVHHIGQHAHQKLTQLDFHVDS